MLCEKYQVVIKLQKYKNKNIIGVAQDHNTINNVLLTH
jgi:hypothetical protein